MHQTTDSPGIVSHCNTMPIVHFARAREVLREYDIELSRYLDLADLPADLLENGTQEVSVKNYYALISHLLKSTDIQGLGLKIGQKFSFADYGILGYAMLSCPTFGDAVKTIVRYQDIIGSYANFFEELYVEDNMASIGVRCQETLVSEDILRFEVEQSFSQWLSPSVIITRSEDFRVHHIDFTFPEPGYSELYQRVFQCPVHFNQPANRLYFSAELLSKPLDLANEATSKVCKQQCDTILENLKQESGLVEQIRQIIMQQPGQPPAPEQIAGQLHISYRTLRRRLNEVDTSLTEIIYDVRMRIARGYLRRTEISIKEIAFLLGYSEVSNFYRSFKKFSGQSPTDYRNNHR